MIKAGPLDWSRRPLSCVQMKSFFFIYVRVVALFAIVKKKRRKVVSLHSKWRQSAAACNIEFLDSIYVNATSHMVLFVSSQKGSKLDGV